MHPKAIHPKKNKNEKNEARLLNQYFSRENIALKNKRRGSPQIINIIEHIII